MLSFKRSLSRRSVIGLDIEPGAVRAVQARVEDGRLVVERAASAALEPGVVRDGEIVDADALAQTLRALFDEHKFDRRVRIGVANQRVVVRHLLLPPISDPRQIETAVRFLASDELPMPVEEAVLDYVVLGQVETPDGPRLRILLVAARRGMIDSLLDVAQAAGLRPEGIDLAAFAMVRSLGSGGPETVLHLAVSGVVNLAVTRNGECVFTRVVPGGMEAMAIELAERRGVTVEEARATLVDTPLGEPAAADDVAEAQTIIEDGIRRIAGEVRNSLDFHLSDDAAGIASDEARTGVERVLLTGRAVAVKGFAELLAQRLSLPVEATDVAGVEPADRGIYAVAAGLAVEEAPV